MVSNMSSARSRAGRPRRLAPLPSLANVGASSALTRGPIKSRCHSTPQRRRPASPALGLAQTIQINDMLRLPGESDGHAAQRLRALMSLGEDQHRAFAGSGGVARYDASPAGIPGVPNDERHLRKVKALARYTAVLNALPSEQRGLVEALVSRTTDEILRLLRAKKIACCRALDQLSVALAKQPGRGKGRRHG